MSVELENVETGNQEIHDGTFSEAPKSAIALEDERLHLDKFKSRI